MTRAFARLDRSDAALLAGAALYAAGARALVRALGRHVPAPPMPPGALPHAAVLVAARDEAHTLGRCLAALRAQHYPSGRLEIIVADDASRDGTADVAREAARGDGHPVQVFSLPEATPGSPLRGKARALHAALEATRAPLLLVTDADCAPPPRWAARTAAAFVADPRLGLAGGLTAIDARPGRLLDALQARDWAWLLAAAAALAAAGRPVTAMGNNMAFRRAAYDAVGGYPALGFSVTEDYALLRAVRARTRWRVAFTAEPDATVRTLPLGSAGVVFRQRLRWVRGGLRAAPAVAAGGAAVYGLHAGLLLGLLRRRPAAVGALALKAAADGTLVRAGFYARAGEIPDGGVVPLAHALASAAYVPLLGPGLLARLDAVWKGRRVA